MTKLYDLIDLKKKGAVTFGRDGRRILLIPFDERVQIYREVEKGKYERLEQMGYVKK